MKGGSVSVGVRASGNGRCYVGRKMLWKMLECRVRISGSGQCRLGIFSEMEDKGGTRDVRFVYLDLWVNNIDKPNFKIKDLKILRIFFLFE